MRDSISKRRALPEICPHTGATIKLLAKLRKFLVSNEETATLTTHDFCEKYIKSWTEPDECSFVDYFKLRYSLLPHPELGLTYAEAFDTKATVLLSHSWGTVLVETLDTLRVYSKSADQDADSAFWIDVLVLNQHISATSSMRETLPDALKFLVLCTPVFLIVVSNRKSPSCSLKRMWCLFELFLCCSLSGTPRFIVNERESEEFTHACLTSIGELIDLLVLDVTKCKTTCGSDRTLLLNYMNGEEDGTRLLQQWNLVISKCIKSWLMTAVQNVVLAQLGPGEQGFGRYAGDRDRLASTVSWLAGMMHEDKQFKSAENLYQRLLTHYASTVGERHVYTIAVKVNFAQLLFAAGKLPEANVMAAEAAYDELKTHGAASNNTLAAFILAGTIADKREAFGEAEIYYEEAMRASDSLLGPSHPKTLDVAFKLGAALASTGKDKRATQLLERVMESYKTMHGMNNMATVDTALRLGALYRKKKRWAKSVEAYTMAYNGSTAVLGATNAKSVQTMLLLEDVTNCAHNAASGCLLS